MKKNITFFFIIILFACGNNVLGEKYVIPEEAPLFSIEIPDDWTVEIEEGMFHAKPADGSISMRIWALENSVLIDETLAAVLKKRLSENFKNFETEEPYEIEMNGMNVMFMEGMGVFEEEDGTGSEMRVSSAMFSPDNKTVFILLYFGVPEAEEAHAQTLEEILTSLQAE